MYSRSLSDMLRLSFSSTTFHHTYTNIALYCSACDILHFYLRYIAKYMKRFYRLSTLVSPPTDVTHRPPRRTNLVSHDDIFSFCFSTLHIITCRFYFTKVQWTYIMTNVLYRASMIKLGYNEVFIFKTIFNKIAIQ